MVAAYPIERLPLAGSVASNSTIMSAAADNSADDLPSRHDIAAESSATSATSVTPVSKSSVAIKKKVTFMDVDGVEQHPGDNEAEHTSSNATAQSEPLASAAAAAAAQFPSSEAAASFSTTSQTVTKTLSTKQTPPSAARPESGNHDDAAHAARVAPAGDCVIVDAARDTPVDDDAAVDDKDSDAAASHTQPLDGAGDVGCVHSLKRLIEIFGEQIRRKMRGDCAVDDGRDECVTRLVRWLLHTLVGSSSSISSGGGGVGGTGGGIHDNTVTPCSNIGSCHADANADQAAAVSANCNSDVRGNVTAPAEAAAAAESFGTEVTVATTPVVTFELRGYSSSYFAVLLRFIILKQSSQLFSLSSLL
jgi:hypothetical protein